MSRHNSFAAMLAGLGDDGDDDCPSCKTPPDVLCITLKEVAARYAQPCPFKPGDLVTPRAGYNKKYAGEPAVVVEVATDPIRNFDCVEDQTDVGRMGFGSRLDPRVAQEVDGKIVPFWLESWMVEPYTGPVASLEDEAA